MHQLTVIEKYSHSEIPPELVIIWLHGLGADGNDFVPLIPELKLTKCVKFIFPTAPMIPITINNGYVMHGWYDIRDLSRLGAAVDMVGINQSVESINQLIESQLALGVQSSQIILAGFSQGGVISLISGIMSSYKLGGVIALSCYLPDVESLVQKYPQNKDLPIFIAHGTVDQVVPIKAGMHAYTALKVAGFDLSWHEYPMGHSVCSEEVIAIANWLSLR